MCDTTARHDVSRPAFDAGDSGGGTHVATGDAKRAAEAELSALGALGEQWGAEGGPSPAERDATFGRYMEVLGGSTW